MQTPYPTPTAATLLDAAQTAKRLPYPLLVRELALLLADLSVQVPARLVQPLPGGARLLIMPALDAHTAITKLITFTPANAGRGLATIQGDVVVFDVATGQRQLILDGPTVTARRTAAVSLLAAQRLAPNTFGPLLIVGAGVQGRAHLDAFAEGLGVKQVVIASGSAASANALAAHAQSLGLQARVVTNADAALGECPLVVTCTPASTVVLSALPRSDAFIAAVGAFTPHMVELGPELCRYVAEHGTLVVDTVDAAHEAGDLLQAGLDVTRFASLADVIRSEAFVVKGPVLFKSCGWAGWDLAAARAALAFSS
ncbi:MAG: delta(1)-pyrroline-2-carboxylate reductase family protein [Gammaproteobacteria bacterium]|uniref:delta(1)-pyrroline-2-carboxylate reductase family protein n=1 Tax=Rhodoferax sp. TaxID=50421 RepID=UPI0017A354FA|nr:delta(1)-pyrroline-2-carboxylate reductase family protein [Rhodoferax sp.]MBU3899852.1 delta(1)-pyrroline-2-carboxylate reductase family protein [Gammaproteobacteria bacterium]MBA3058615.1 delta(1)-pyrroline-2-carboxylate reductase family protein [Rhodoferax sp.]MBU3996035.1 delta(1)-pyrroline-2-carboxylate reductase family protein [Gammaproteobacteria bacterium]MBU4019117.1 delta(1)-pyrroline-2-carboxylate reductase family protein [Gammaproteobacteria bacterium]MBU4078835.1 delta(1)-pyrrol